MTTPVRNVQPGSSQTRPPPQTRSQSQLPEEFNLEQDEDIVSEADYLFPRVEGAPEVKLSKTGKLAVPIPPIDPRVKENGDLVGYAAAVKFVYYNLADGKTYPHFKSDQYLRHEQNPRTAREELVPMPHVQILEPTGLLNLLRLPHFGRSAEVNAVVRVLLSCLHGGYLWLGRQVDLNIDLIHRITGLSKTGKLPDLQISGKTKDSKLPPALVKKYKLQRGGRAYDITSIENETLRFTASLLAGRLLTKVRPKEVTGSVISLAVQVTEGEQFNWSLFLLNMLQEDFLAAQD